MFVNSLHIIQLTCVVSSKKLEQPLIGHVSINFCFTGQPSTLTIFNIDIAYGTSGT